MGKGRTQNRINKLGSMVVLSSLLACGCIGSAMAMATELGKASMSVSGQGVAPFAEVSLSAGAGQVITSKADQNGNFAFSNLQYSSLSELKFSLDLPPNSKGIVNHVSGSHLDFFYDPRGSKTSVRGTIGKSGVLSLSLAGSMDPLTQIAGSEGYVTLQTRTELPVASGESRLIASIINVGETCCPRLLVPAPPVTLTISSVPLAGLIAAPSVGGNPAVTPKSVVPYVRKESTSSPSLSPSPSGKYLGGATHDKTIEDNHGSEHDEGDGAPPDDSEPKKKKIPYIVQGRVDIEGFYSSGDDSYAAVSFSSSDYDKTYVGGLKKMSDDKRNLILHSIAALGGFMDGRAFMDALRSLEVSMAQSLKNYTVSDSICQFGTLSRSLAFSDAVRDKNRLAFSKIMAERNNQKLNSLYSGARATYNLLADFQGKYCRPVDNAGFLAGYCAAASASADLIQNRDVDFTRTFDVPLTFDADFTTTASTNDKKALISLFHNLALSPYYVASQGQSFDPNNELITTQDARAINAARGVAENSFGALVAERTKATSQSATYMKQVLTSLGVSAADATKLVGDSPSYFAQMEVMSKKLFQNPNFYANLYDSAANIDRQRVAMKAIELQQERDFLESLRRREMLLSVLLDMRVRTEASRANESGVVNKK